MVLSQVKENYQVHLLDYTRAYCIVLFLFFIFLMIGVAAKADNELDRPFVGTKEMIVKWLSVDEEKEDSSHRLSFIVSTQPANAY